MIKKKDLSKKDIEAWETYIKNPSDIYDKDKDDQKDEDSDIHKIKITIKSLNGNKNVLKVAKDVTVKSIKIKLEEIEGIRFNQLRLIYRGRLLLDTDKLDEKNIKNDDLIPDM